MKAALALLVCLAACAPGAAVRSTMPGDQATAFVDVTVIPMDRERELAHQTVVVEGGRIAAVGPVDAVAVPDGARRIDGRGKFLIPGLADMHVHMFDERSRSLFVGMGVTTVRCMWGMPSVLRLREAVRSGREPLSPWIYTAGPILDGDPPVFPNMVVVKTAAEGAERVHAQKRAGYDFIKVYARLTREAYDGIMSAAKEDGLPVTGHVAAKVGLAHALEAGQRSIEHVDAYVFHAQRDDSPFRDKPPDWKTFLTTAYRHTDEAKIADAVARTKLAGAWSCPTLVQDDLMARGDRLAAAGLPEFRFVPPVVRAGWDPKQDYLTKDWTAEDFAHLREEAAWNRALVGRLGAAGARIVAGTDLGNAWLVPGFSLHHELALLVAAGLTPYQALRSATAAPAELLGAEAEMGTVAVGRRADLVLLDADPLADISRSRQIAGVMLRGRWMPEAELAQRREELAAVYRGERSRFAGRASLGAAGPVVLAARFSDVASEMVVGEERLVVARLPDGTLAAVGEQVPDDGPETRVELDLGVGDAGARLRVFRDDVTTKRVDVTLVRAGGRARLTGTLGELDETEAIAVDEPIAADEILGGPGLASDLAYLRRLAGLALPVGGTTQLKLVRLFPRPRPRLVRLAIQATRLADGSRTLGGRSVPVRSYALEAEGTKWTVALDAGGWPVATDSAVRAE